MQRYMSFHVPQPIESFLTNATLKRCLTSMDNTVIFLMIHHRNIFHIFHIYMALILNALSLHVSSYSINDWTFHHMFHKHKNSFGQVFAFCNLPNDYLVIILWGYLFGLPMYHIHQIVNFRYLYMISTSISNFHP